MAFSASRLYKVKAGWGHSLVCYTHTSRAGAKLREEDNLPGCHRMPLRAGQFERALFLKRAGSGGGMSPEEITVMLEQVRSRKLTVEAAVDRLRNLPFEDIGYARIDHHRSLRQGFPEVIFARGKSPDHVVGIVQGMLRNRHNILITRGNAELYELIKPLDKRTQFHVLSGSISIQRDRKIRGRGKILVVSAGTSDIPVAEEAQVQAEGRANRVEFIYDAAVANIHRILARASNCAAPELLLLLRAWKGHCPAWWPAWSACR